MIKRWPWMILAAILVLTLARSAFLIYASTRVTALTVHVTGNVDEVAFYKTSTPGQPMAVIRTGGQDVVQVVYLPNSDFNSFLVQPPGAVYFYEARKGASTYRGPRNGFSTFQATSELEITGLDSGRYLD